MLHRYSESVAAYADPVQLSAMHVLTCGAPPCTSYVTVKGGTTTQSVTTEPVIPVTMTFNHATTNQAISRPILVTVRTTDADSNSVMATAAAIVTIVQKNLVRKKVEQTDLRGVNSNTILLALFDFDSDSFSAVNIRVADSVRKAIREGAFITVIAGTDEFGSADYNRQLQIKRAEAAVRYLGIPSAMVTYEFTSADPQTAHNPAERAYQRAVRIRIAQKGQQ
ncbi:MAG: hypothetical protein IAE64_00185 [Flavobacteriales bacterium]|nr:hypothetical protein [Flavobacteriales bacterium]